MNTQHSMLFENAAESAEIMREVLSLCRHFEGREILVGHSDTETLDEARAYAAAMINPTGSPHLWLVQCKAEPYMMDGQMTDWRTLAVAAIAISRAVLSPVGPFPATLLPRILPPLVVLADAQAKEEAALAEDQREARSEANGTER